MFFIGQNVAVITFASARALVPIYQRPKAHQHAHEIEGPAKKLGSQDQAERHWAQMSDRNQYVYPRLA